MAGLVVSYFYLPAAKPIFGVLTDWNVHGGLLFSFVAMGITVGGLTEIFSVYLHKNGRWTGEDLENMVFNFLVFGFLGVMNSLFYQLQAHWFGAGRSPSILATKTFVDQFLYTPFLEVTFRRHAISAASGVRFNRSPSHFVATVHAAARI